MFHLRVQTGMSGLGGTIGLIWDNTTIDFTARIGWGTIAAIVIVVFFTTAAAEAIPSLLPPGLPAPVR